MIAFVWTVHTYAWPGPLGWIARNCPGNVVAGFLQVGIAAAVASVLLPRTRRWWGRHADRLRDWALRPVHTKLDAHHAAVLAQAEDHHRQLMSATRPHPTNPAPKENP